MALKDNLKRLRERAGYENGKELADAIGIAYPRYMTYERGSWPNEETLIKIATKLHVSINDLLGYQPPSPDEFMKCKSFIESACFGVDIYLVSIEADNRIAIHKKNMVKNTQKRICTFESKNIFIQFVEKLKQAFPESIDYRFAVFTIIEDHMYELYLLTMMGYKIDEKIVSIPLLRLTQVVAKIHHQKSQQLSEMLSNPKNEQIFKQEPELRNVLTDNLNIINGVMERIEDCPPSSRLSPRRLISNKLDRTYGTDDEQTKEKAATPKSDGKEND